jgi:GAF domain
MLFLFPLLLTMLIPSAAGLAASDRRLRAKPGVERPLEGSWSDGAIIPRSARCLLDGFDPAGTLLLFSCRNRISGCFTPIRGTRGLTVSSLATGRVGKRSACGSTRFLLLNEGLGRNTVSPHSTPAWERDGAVGTPLKLDPRGYAARRTRLCGGAGDGTCAGHRGAVEFLAAFHEQRRSRRQQGATYPHRWRTEGFARAARQALSTAQEELDRLYKVVREAGYTILFCDSAGVAIEHRGEQAEAGDFEYWGTWLGGVWAEEIEGTNGIGTCITEERPVTVHRTQHFRSRHINLSCSGAPIFGVDGQLLAVLDVSAIDPLRSERAHALTGA